MDEGPFEHVVFCDAGPDSAFSSVDRTLEPSVRERLRVSAEAVRASQARDERCAAAFQRLREDARYGDRQAADFLLLLGWDGS